MSEKTKQIKNVSNGCFGKSYKFTHLQKLWLTCREKQMDNKQLLRSEIARKW